MIKLYVVRHGNALCNEKKLAASISEKHCGGLSKLGERQAEDLVSELLKHEYDAIIVSPMIRAYQTIMPYFKTFTHPPNIIISDLVLERDLGDLKGKILEEVKKIREGMTDSEKISWIPVNGESLLDVQNRVYKFISYLKDNFEGQSVLLCSHSVFLRVLNIVLEKKDIGTVFPWEAPDHGLVKSYNIG